MRTIWFMVATGRGMYYRNEGDWFADADDARRMRLPDARRMLRHVREVFARGGEDIRRFPRIAKATLEITTAKGV